MSIRLVFELAFVGEAIYLYLYDLGGYVDLAEVRKVFEVSSGDLKREQKVPRYVSITPQPLFYELPTQRIAVEGGQRQMRIQARIHEVGAVSILFRIQLDGELQDFINYSSPYRIGAYQGGQRIDLSRLSSDYADQILGKLASSLSRRCERDETPEEYTVLCISNLPQGKDAIQFVQQNKKVFTGMLREIDDVERISESESESALKYWVLYSSDYLVIVDWASSIIVQTNRDYEDYLLTIELANLQLLQLRAFDKLVDRLIDRAYSDTRYLSNPSLLSILSVRGLSATVADIAEMRMELTDVLDKVMNITKFFGDYSLAKLYEYLSARLHLQEWEKTVSQKLATLGDVYQMASDKVASRQMIVLETLIVLLFVFEVLVTIYSFIR